MCEVVRTRVSSYMTLLYSGWLIVRVCVVLCTTLKMISTKVDKTSVLTNHQSSQDYTNLDDQPTTNSAIVSEVLCSVYVPVNGDEC